MNFLVYLFYPVLIGLLFYKSRFFKKNEWNEDFLSLKQSKAFQGFCAVCIIFHHMSQRTCVNWIPSEYYVHGLEAFPSIGYLLVAVFFFFSGFGLILSVKTKENYLNGFLDKHIWPIILALLTTGLVFLVGRTWMQIDFARNMIIPFPLNPYNWFAITLIIFYLIFYAVFKLCKNKTVALYITVLGIFAYIFICDYFIVDTWCYNSVTAFIAGLLFAQYKEKVINFAKKHYLLCLILMLIITVISFYCSTLDKNIVSRLVILISQMICSVTFVFSCLLLGMKVQIGNKALYFLASFTLELYLLHGFFVQIFSYAFISDNSLSTYYIKSLPLYVLVVLIFSIPLSYLLHIIHKFVAKLFKKYTKFTAKFKKDGKIIVKVLLIFIVVIICFSSISSHKNSKEVAETFEKYKKENLSFIQADEEGNRMAVYSVGEGDHTLVMTGPWLTTLSYKKTVDNLVGKNAKIIVLDLLGTGFSDCTLRKRTVENVAEEIHTVLDNLNVTQPCIFFSHTSTGPYIQMYSNMYPNQVEAIIGMDTFVSEEFFNNLKASNINEKEFRRMILRRAQTNLNFQKLRNASGIIEWYWAIYEGLFERGWTESEKNVLRELFKRSNYTENAFDQELLYYDNFEKTRDMKYPENVPVFFLLGYDTVHYHYFYGDWVGYHQNLFTDSPLCELHEITGDQYGVYWNQKLMVTQISNIIEKLEK